MGTATSLRLVLRVPPHPISVGVARGAVRSLRAVIGEAMLDRGELVVSELVTNAVRHGSRRCGDDIVLELSAIEHGLAGAVCDHGPQFDVPAGASDPEQPGGFGLHLVDELTSSWSVTRGSQGNDVRFRL